MTDRPTIVDALEMWATWHGEVSPLGTTGDYALDMLLADAFRALLYRPGIDAKLKWLLREIAKPHPDAFRRHLIRWFLDISEAAKTPVIESRINNRSSVCATC